MPGTDEPADGLLRIEVDHDAGASEATVRVAGEVDIATAGQLTAALEGVLVGGATEVRIDLTEVGFMDSTGLTTLIEVNARLDGTGAVRVTAASPSVRRTIETAGLGTLFAFP